MKFNISNNVTRTISKFGLKLKKHSPEILIVAGIAGTVTSAVLACKATTKLSSVLDEAKEQLDQIHEYTETKGYSEKYTEEDGKKDLAIVYTQTGVKLVKMYAPAIILGALSIGAIVTSNNVLRKRNVALAAAYTAVDKSFKEYRGRVVERFGKELDRELRFGIKAKEIEKTVTNEDGTTSTVKETIEVVDKNPSSIYSDYARFFDDGCPGYEKDAEHNLKYLRMQEKFANQKLQCEGYLFLNDVYDMLGFPKTAAGQCVGWVYKGDGDGYVDFGLYDIDRANTRDFVNGYERVILLDFNVDGNILDLI